MVGTLVELGLDTRLGLGWPGLGMGRSRLGLGCRLGLGRTLMGRTAATSLAWRRMGKQQHRCRTSSPSFVRSLCRT